MCKRITMFNITTIIAIFLFGCGKGVVNNEEPNVPFEYQGRLVEVQGTLRVQSREVTFRTWDAGRLVDGDIISLVVNDKIVLDTFVLKGPEEKQEIQVTLDFDGYNYVLLFAHNEGTVSPNTIGLSIEDGSEVQVIEIAANLETNGAYHIIVE